jgi:hypothetical protein
MRRKSLLAAVTLALCSQFLLSPSAALAHNKVVHEGMTMRAYAIMLVASRKHKQGQPLGPRPAGVSQADWVKFHEAISAALPKLDKIAGSNDAVIKLAQATSDPDYFIDDTHLFVKLTNSSGLSGPTKMGDEATKLGIEIALVPLVCTVSCLGELFGLGNGTCKKCLKASKNLANEVPTPGDLANLIPGAGDITSSQYTGLWHFVNMSSVPQVTNDFDDHQGLFYEVAGPFQMPGLVDAGIMALTDAAGLSINPEKSIGVLRYQIAAANDTFNDGDEYTSTLMRSHEKWQKYAIGHLVFEPVDNFALWGWRGYRDGGPGIDRRMRLGYTLHAIGDATVPMHVVGTTAWGHRPFEDAQERLWDNKIRDVLDNDEILAKAFFYRQEILAWQAQGHPGDIPVRHLVRTVALNTLKYSKQKQGETGDWPYNDPASLIYFEGDSIGPDSVKDAAIDTYKNRNQAALLVRPLIEDGNAATLAVLISAGEASGLSRNGPRPSDQSLAFLPANWSPGLSISPEREVTAPAPQTDETPAQEKLGEEIRINYALLARLLILDEISPADYLQRVRNLTEKANKINKDPAFADEVAKADRDGDLVPDVRDRCPDTRPRTATDARGCPLTGRPPRAPARRDLQRFFGLFNTLVSPKCNGAPQPGVPHLLKVGTSSVNRDLMFAVTPVTAPNGCEDFYEFGIDFVDVTTGNVNFLPENAYREAVFRRSQGVASSVAGQQRVVFRIPREPVPADALRKFMLDGWGRYNKYRWRVRVVRANGSASAWSDWKDAGNPISFGEP